MNFCLNFKCKTNTNLILDSFNFKRKFIINKTYKTYNDKKITVFLFMKHKKINNFHYWDFINYLFCNRLILKRP
jgi:hypothetical protein